MVNEEIEMAAVVVFKIIMIEKMVEIMHDEVDSLIVVVHEEVIMITDKKIVYRFCYRSRWFW